MPVDRQTASQLRRFAQAFKDARDRGCNESDTVMYLVKFFEDVLGYDSLGGEISKEYAIKPNFCDIAIKLDGKVRFLVEAKTATIDKLRDAHITQAENYAARDGIRWVVLTNGIEWNLYHLTWSEGDGIAHDLAWSANLLEGVEKDADSLWGLLRLISKESVRKNELEEYWDHKKALSPAAVVRTLFREEVLRVIRRELRKESDILPDVEDVFKAVRDVLSKEALADAGDLGIRRKKKRRRRVTKTDATGQTTTEEVEEDVPEDEDAEVDAEPKAPSA